MCAGGGVGSGGDRANQGFYLQARDAAGAKQDGLWPGERKNGGLDANVAGTAVEYVVHVRSQATADVVGGGGRELREAVGAGGGERDAGGLDQCERDGVSGHAQAYGGKAGGDDQGNCPRRRRCRAMLGRCCVGLGKDQCQRAGPELLGQAGGGIGPGDERVGHFIRRHVNDQGAGCGPAFDGEDTGDGFRIQGVGAEAIDRFGGERDQTSSAEEVGGVFDLSGVDQRQGLGHRLF